MSYIEIPPKLYQFITDNNLDKEILFRCIINYTPENEELDLFINE